MFIKESHGGVYRHEYVYCVATVHSTLIMSSVKIMH
jgi:hypothetical protein